MQCPECLRQLEPIEESEERLYKCKECGVEYSWEELHQSENDFAWDEENIDEFPIG
jgi:DNA-directed RNA polymerase subunit M/transcription elongation factor TFIIS